MSSSTFCWSAFVACCDVVPFWSTTPTSSRNLEVMFTIESDVTDGRLTKEGNRRVVSRQLDFLEIGAGAEPIIAGHAPYLDCRALTDEEASVATRFLGAMNSSRKRWRL
jgi:hypothetical protein